MREKLLQNSMQSKNCNFLISEIFFCINSCVHHDLSSIKDKKVYPVQIYQQVFSSLSFSLAASLYYISLSARGYKEIAYSVEKNDSKNLRTTSSSYFNDIIIYSLAKISHIFFTYILFLYNIFKF
jgi:hypothetical protein